MTSTVFTHTGVWSAHSRSHPALSFLEKYGSKVDNRDLSGPSSAFYSPTALFHDKDNTIYNGGERIWAWMHELFAPFERIWHELIAARLIEEQGGGRTVYEEYLARFRLIGDPDPVIVPRFFVSVVEKVEGRGGRDGWVVV